MTDTNAAQTLSNSEIAAADLADWRKLGQALHARFRIGGLAEGADLAAAIAAEPATHPPEVRLGSGFVDLAVGTRENGIWVTAADVALARRISALAAERGLASAPGEVSQVEYGLDTDRWERIAPFWAALMTGDAEQALGNNVLDPTNRVANIWFQGTEPHEPPRQRWHPDLWVAPETAEARIAAAVAAGGRVVDDTEAPSFTVLADPDGNRVCVCTSLDR